MKLDKPISCDDAAVIIGVTGKTVRQKIISGKIKAIKLEKQDVKGSNWLIERAEAVQYARERAKRISPKRAEKMNFDHKRGGRIIYDAIGVTEAATIIGCNRSRVIQMLGDNEIVGYRVGGKSWVLEREDANRFIGDKPTGRPKERSGL